MRTMREIITDLDRIDSGVVVLETIIMNEFMGMKKDHGKARTKKIAIVAKAMEDDWQANLASAAAGAGQDVNAFSKSEDGKHYREAYTNWINQKLQGKGAAMGVPDFPTTEDPRAKKIRADHIMSVVGKFSQNRAMGKAKKTGAPSGDGTTEIPPKGTQAELPNGKKIEWQGQMWGLITPDGKIGQSVSNDVGMRAWRASKKSQ